MNSIKNLINKSFFLTTRLSFVSSRLTRPACLFVAVQKTLPSLCGSLTHIFPALNASSVYTNQVREYKAKVRLRKRCKSCKFVWRNGRLYVDCAEHPRHKQHHVDSLIRGFNSLSNGYSFKHPHLNE